MIYVEKKTQHLFFFLSSLYIHAWTTLRYVKTKRVNCSEKSYSITKFLFIARLFFCNPYWFNVFASHQPIAAVLIMSFLKKTLHRILFGYCTFLLAINVSEILYTMFINSKPDEWSKIWHLKQKHQEKTSWQ